MLVLIRKVGQQIMIGDDVQITVTRIQGGRISLGVMAPRSVPISRVELPKPAPAEGPEQPIGEVRDLPEKVNIATPGQ